MRVLITGAHGQLARAIAEQLAGDHQLRLMDSVEIAVDDPAEFICADVLDIEQTWSAVRGMDAVIHTAEFPGKLPDDPLARDQAILDFKTRGTHNVMRAAVDAGVKRLIYASSLLPMSHYADDVYVTEYWKPMPSVDMAELACYLGEVTAREFARDNLVTVTCLRLGEIVSEDAVAGQPLNFMWLDVRDAAHAFACALGRDRSLHPFWQHRYAVYHIVADLPDAKFLIDRAAYEIGYRPQHNFDKCVDAD